MVDVVVDGSFPKGRHAMVDVVVDGSFPKGRHVVSLSLYRTRPLLKQAKETQQKTQAFLLSIPAHGRGTFVHIVR